MQSIIRSLKKVIGARDVYLIVLSYGKCLCTKRHRSSALEYLYCGFCKNIIHKCLTLECCQGVINNREKLSSHLPTCDYCMQIGACFEMEETPTNLFNAFRRKLLETYAERRVKRRISYGI